VATDALLHPMNDEPNRNNQRSVVALAGGIGGSRFLRGLRHALQERTARDGVDTQITVIGNTGDDIWIHGLRVCPDLDTVMYTLGGGISEERGWGREQETFTVKEELATYGVEPTWFGLGDRDIATHLVRTQALAAGYTLSEVTMALCERWQPGVRLLPMSDDRAETHVLVDDPEHGRTAIHFQQWWIKHRAALPAHGFPIVGIDEARPAPGVIEAIGAADVILLPPSNPIVSIGTILSVPGIRDALIAAPAPIIGLSPIIGDAPVRGMADACLTALGVPTTAAGVAAHYGGRTEGGLLDGWLIDSTDAAHLASITAMNINCRAIPLYMTSVEATALMAESALELAQEVHGAQQSRP
jgi:LPPG:FO 2-phospho-L-lactate transferase